MKLRIVCFAIALLSLTSLAWADTCTHCYYLTAGDQARMTIVNLDTHGWWQTPLYGNEYAIAVFPTYENTVGAYNNPGGQYDPVGNAIAPLNNVWTGGQWLDGTTDLINNYAVDFYGDNGVYKTDTVFNNAQLLFTVGPGVASITYAAGNLWLLDRWGNPGRVTEYSMAGVPLFFFDTGIQASGALAYDATNNSLWLTSTWDCPSGTCLYEYSMAGALMDSFSIPVYDNIIGGEISPVPEPGILLLMGSGALGVLGVLRRKLF